MRIAVVGLWHLGTVTAACLAEAGHEVTGIDGDAHVISGLKEGRFPVEEPGLAALTQKHIRTGKLRFSALFEAACDQDVVWITFDTPVDDDDVADVNYVFRRAAALLPMMADDAIMLVSSQMPVGSLTKLEGAYRDLALGNRVRFAYSPENLRLGNAIEVFMRPDRVVVGIRSQDDRERLAPIWSPFTDRIEWMSVESAEMTKHALNAFLATSVAFTNEIARICEQVGADAREVERGLKSDIRIGRRAYLHPGAAFAGGTLARDLVFLRDTASTIGIDPAFLNGVMRSNKLHQSWLQNRFSQCIGSPEGKIVAILGLTYKPGTSTLRRSSAVETSRWLLAGGASVRAFDPAVRGPNPQLPDRVQIADAAEKVLAGAGALLIATAWPEFLNIAADAVVQQMTTPIVIDPFGHLEETLGRDRRIRYYSVGRAS